MFDVNDMVCALYAFIGSLGFLLRTYQKYYVLITNYNKKVALYYFCAKKTDKMLKLCFTCNLMMEHTLSIFQ